MNWTIDLIIEHASNRTATFLNACHACRPDHPWYGTDGNPFDNLAWLACGRIRGDAIDWLKREAKKFDEAST